MAATDSPYRYVVVPRGLPFFGVFDRATDQLVADDLSRREARQIVWAKNRRLDRRSFRQAETSNDQASIPQDAAPGAATASADGAPNGGAGAA